MTLKKLESWIGENRRLVLNVILGGNLFLCLALFDPKPNCGGDNAVYITLAESILRPGDGYSLSFTPGEPKPYTLAPFGYPLLLAPFSALFGRNLIVFKLISLVFTIGSVALFALLIRPLFAPLTWAALTMAAAFNPVIVNYSHWILSEIPFLFFSLLSLKLLLESETREQQKPGRWFWLALACIAFTAHIRAVGLALAGAGVLYYALHRKLKKLVLFSLCLALLLAPWMIRNNLARGNNGVTYTSQFLQKDIWSPEKGTVGIADLVSRIKFNIQAYSTKHFAQMIFGSENETAKGFALSAVSLLAAFLAYFGLLRNLFTTAHIFELYAISYTGVLLIWPEIWSDVRLLLPIVPLLLIYLADGAAARFLKRKLSVYPVSSAAIVLFVASVGLGAQIVRIPANLQMIRAYLNGDRYAGYIPSWRHFFQAADWARENTAESSVFTVRKPSLFYLHSARKSAIYPFSRDADSVFAQVSKTDYVVVQGLEGIEPLENYHITTIDYLEPVMTKYRYNFKLVFQTDYPATRIWEIDRFWNEENELEKLRKDSELDPSDKRAAMGAAEILLERGRFDSAEVFVQRILTHHYGSLPDLLQIIKLYIQHGNPEQAREILLSELEKASSGILYAILAHVNKALGLEEESARCLKRAVSLGVTEFGLAAIGEKLNIDLISSRDTTNADR